jgi:hypothetical protein
MEVTCEDTTKIEICLVEEVKGTYGSDDRMPWYPDLLNPRSTESFIENSHAVFKEMVGGYFGNTIPIIFTDEPKILNPPWTDGLVQSFKEEKGYDILKFLPYIFNDEEDGAKVRIDFYDWWTMRFTENYFGKIQEWCSKNSLLSTGHLGGEHYTLGNIKHGFGHILRVLRKFDIPCVDVIWRQLYPDYKETNHFFPKYASSTSHQAGKPWAATESFAIYGSGLTLDIMKWITDYQYVRGINITTMSCAHLSMKEEFIKDGRPSFIPNESSPLWKYMDLYNSYTARLSYVLSLGKPVIKSAIYFPIRDIWAGGKNLNSIVESHDKLAQLLLEKQNDFDLIDDDVLEDQLTKITEGKLIVGPMKYDTVYISKSRWMSEKSKCKLEEFAAQGGKTIYVENTNNHNCKLKGALYIEINEIDKYIQPLIKLEPENSMIRVCCRQIQNSKLYFITNEDTEKTSCKVIFNETMPLYIIDAETGNCWRPEEAYYANSQWMLPLDLAFAGSCIVLFTDNELSLEKHPEKLGKDILLLDEGWVSRILKSYIIGEHEFEVRTMNAELFPVKLGNWTQKLGENFSGDVEYILRFNCTEEESKKCTVLDLGTVKYACKVIINDKNIGRKAWEPFIFPLKGKVKVGINELKVIVTNTMANQYINNPILDKWPDIVIASYHKICTDFEKDTVKNGSGLYGPVRILGT